jgi:hypothetical protein
MGGVKVFANVNATLIQERKKDLEAGQLMACHVATIVKHNVNTAHFRYDGSQKCRIILRTDAYMSVAFIELTATIVNIDPEQKGFGPEIPSPQRQRTALRDTDFEHMERRVTEP